MEEYMKGITWDMNNYPRGGQQVSLCYTGCKLTHEDLGFSVTICSERSQIKNRELCLKLFKMFVCLL